MYDTEKIGERIKKLRKKHGMTQTELAQVIHISDKSAISRYENGVKELSIENVVKIAECFDVSLDYLLLGKEAMDDSILDAFQKIPDEYKDVANKMIMAALKSLV